MRALITSMILLAMIAASAAVAQPVGYEVLYAITDDEQHRELNSGLLILDPNTGQASVVGYTIAPDVSGLSVNSAGTLFATDQTYLYRIDPTTGLETLIDFIFNEEFAAFWRGLAFDENDVLYAVSRSGYLVTVDTMTAETEFIGDTQITNLKGLAFDPHDGTLYASHGNIDAIYTINKSNAVPSLIGFTDLRRGVRGIAFTGHGQMYGITEGGDGKSDLILIDKSTGLGTNIGSTGYSRVSGMAIRADRVTGVGSPTRAPGWLRVTQNTPNPFNPTTTITYILDARAEVTVEVYDVRGRLARTFPPRVNAAGVHHLTWYGRSDRGDELPSGVYVIRVIADSNGHVLTRSRKATLLK